MRNKNIDRKYKCGVSFQRPEIKLRRYSCMMRSYTHPFKTGNCFNFIHFKEFLYAVAQIVYCFLLRYRAIASKIQKTTKAI